MIPCTRQRHHWIVHFGVPRIVVEGGRIKTHVAAQVVDCILPKRTSEKDSRPCKGDDEHKCYRSRYKPVQRPCGQHIPGLASSALQRRQKPVGRVGVHERVRRAGRWWVVVRTICTVSLFQLGFLACGPKVRAPRLPPRCRGTTRGTLALSAPHAPLAHLAVRRGSAVLGRPGTSTSRPSTVRCYSVAESRFVPRAHPVAAARWGLESLHEGGREEFGVPPPRSSVLPR